jgi:hypothetical protein
LYCKWYRINEDLAYEKITNRAKRNEFRALENIYLKLRINGRKFLVTCNTHLRCRENINIKLQRNWREEKI